MNNTIDIKQLQKVPIEHYPHKVKNKPLVSVCVQTYQHVNYIKACLDGILMQKTDFAFEILLGEDESADGTREICIESAQKYPDKIRLFLHKRENVIYMNGKPTGRFNMLYNLNEARGKYMAFCEGDDYWTDPYKLQKQVDLMEKYSNASMCVALNKVLTSDKEYINNKYDYSNSPLLYFPDIKEYFHTSTYLIRKSNMDNVFVKYKNLILEGETGDTPLLFLLIYEGPIAVLNDFVSVYRTTGTGIWTSLEDYKKDLIHYKLFRRFRIYHVKERRKFYARNELWQLHKIIIYKLKTKDFSGIGTLLKQYIMLIVRYNPFFLLKISYFYYKKALKIE